MFVRSVRGSVAALGLLAAAAVQAQSVAPSSRPDPLDPKADVPPAAHRSSFGGYRPAADAGVGSWKQANDTVARIGGWRAYAREAGQADAPASGPAPGAGHPQHGKP